MKTKLTILLMVLSLLLVSVPCAAYIDTDGSEYENAVDTLSALGIVEGMTEEYFEPQGKVTRAQMAAISVRLMGAGADTTSTIFEDVPSEHWASGVINAAYKLGIINGISASLFAPEETVTYEQAVKMLVCVLGYDVQAKAQGGFPAGYLAVASRLDLLRGVSNKMYRGDMAILVYNALDVPLFSGETYSGDGITSYKEQDRTILTAFLRLEPIHGIVNANAYETLSGSRAQNGMIVVGEEELFVGTSTIENAIGRKVTAYASKTDGEDAKTVIAFRIDKRSSEKTLYAGQILPETDTKRLYYQLEDGTDKRDIDIKNDAILMYNGSPVKNWTKDDITPSVGTVTLISNNGNEADVIIVWEYSTEFITSTDNELCMLYTKDSADKVYEYEIVSSDADKKIRMESEKGTVIGFDALKTDMVLSCAKDKNGVLRKMILAEASVTGTVTEISDKVTIEGTEYIVEEALLKDISVGISGKFNLDHLGRIVMLDKNAVTNWKYGYALRLAQEKGLNGASYLKLFSEEGKMEVLPIAEKVEVNELTVTRDLLFKDAYSLEDAQKIAIVPFARSGSVKEQLIRYELNGVGEICKVFTAKDGNNYSDEEREAIFTKDWSGDQTMYLGHTLKSFNSRHMMTDKSIIFNVPAAYNNENDKEYAIQKMANLTHAEIYKNASIYDLTEYNDIGVLVLRGGGSTDKNVGDYAMVVGMGRGLMEDGTACETLRLYDSMGGGEMLLYNPDEVQVYFRGFALTNTEGENAEEHIVNEGGTIQLKETIALSDLHPGDIIKYAKDGNVLTSITCLLRAKTPVVGEKAYEGTSMKWTSEKMDYYPTLYLYSEAKKVSSRTFKFDVPLTGGEIVERVHVFSTAPVLIFDTEKETYRVASAAAMREGDKFFASRANPYERLIVIYR